MDRRFLFLALVLLILSTGCTVDKHTIKITTEAVPSKISLTNPEPISVKVSVKNIGTSIETVTADITKTEGVEVTSPNKTVFTLKPGESRTVTFIGRLRVDAVPGDYIIDTQIRTTTGDLVTDRVKVRVVKTQGWF